MELVKPYIHLVSFPNRRFCRLVYFQHTVVIKPYNMSPWITFDVYGLHNVYIRDECPKKVQWLGNYLATVFNRLDLIPADEYLLHKMPNAFYYSVTCIQDQYLIRKLPRSPWYWNLLNKILESKTCVRKKEFILTDQSRRVATNLRRVKSNEI